MITLYSTLPWPQWKVGNASPASLKFETWMRMVGLEYQVKPTQMSDFTSSPKGKIPFIEYEGKTLCDSALIIDFFRREKGIDLDEGLSPYERAISLAFRRMLKEHVYWMVGRTRYYGDNWEKYRKEFGSFFPAGTPEEVWGPVSQQLGDMIRDIMQKQGAGRYTDEEHTFFAKQDLDAVSNFLGEKPFLMGEKPTLLDATAYGYLANLLLPDFPHPIQDYGRQRKNIVAFLDRMQKRYWPEYG